MGLLSYLLYLEASSLFVDGELGVFVLDERLHLGTNFKEINLSGNFVRVNLFQFWTHFEKIDPLGDILSGHMLKLVLNVHEIDFPEEIMGVNFREFGSDLEEINLLPDLLRSFLTDVHEVDSLPHFLGSYLVGMLMARFAIKALVIFDQELVGLLDIDVTLPRLDFCRPPLSGGRGSQYLDRSGRRELRSSNGRGSDSHHVSCHMAHWDKCHGSVSGDILWS